MTDPREMYDQVNKAAHYALTLTSFFRNFDIDSGVRLYRSFLDLLRQIYGNVFSKEAEELGINADAAEYSDIVKSLLDCQEAGDYVLLADILDGRAYPFLADILVRIRVSYNASFLPDYYESNVTYPAQADPMFGELMRQVSSQMALGLTNAPDADIYEVNDTVYVVEYTETGYPTVKVEDCHGAFYLHSNKDPYEEGKGWTSAFINEKTKEYHILGMGLGYAGISLFGKLLKSYPVHMYEEDPYMIYLALKYVNFGDMLRTGLFIHYDPGYLLIGAAAKGKEKRLIIHPPSLRRIADSEIKAIFERYYIEDCSLRNSEIMLAGNFDRNMKLLDENPAKVQPFVNGTLSFDGKTVYIVAAGPSLDKNISLLAGKTENADFRSKSCIIAVGTVLRKLLNAGIYPDYVIVTEGNYRATSQVKWLPESDVPMLMLSTANPGYIQEYDREHFILFQKDYEKAEEMAGKLGGVLFETGGSVATLAVDVSIRCGAKRIVTLGLDLAFTDNLAHAEGTSNRIATDMSELSPVDGVNGDVVYSDNKFTIYRRWIEKRIAGETGIEFIDATEGGSLIRGMKIMKLNEVTEDI